MLDVFVAAVEEARRFLDFLRTGRKRTSLLVLHDIDNWAIDHVFSLWFADPGDMRVTRTSWNRCASARAFRSFDLVVFGYFDMLLKYDYRPEDSVVVVHDPCEIFPQVADWKSSPPLEGRLERLRALKSVIVISVELERILTGYGVRCFRIPTMSRMPVRDSLEIDPLPVRAVSVLKDYPRKNRPLLDALGSNSEFGAQWSLRLHTGGLDEREYQQMLDEYPIYLCTSWQEGGPLPAMDAISRGSVVVSTAVGQLPEFLVHGQSAFFCEGQTEFVEILKKLIVDPVLLQKTRLEGMAAYRKARDPKAIQARAREAFVQFCK